MARNVVGPEDRESSNFSRWALIKLALPCTFCCVRYDTIHFITQRSLVDGHFYPIPALVEHRQLSVFVSI